MADIVDRTFLLLQKLFRQVPIPYAIIGGFAGNVWGVDRATLDIDLLVGGRRSQFDRLITLAAEHGLQPQAQFLGMNPLLRGSMVRCRIDDLHVTFSVLAMPMTEMSCAVAAKRSLLDMSCGFPLQKI